MKQAYCKYIMVILVVWGMSSCQQRPKEIQEQDLSQEQNEALFTAALTTHLNAVMNKDIATLKSTMSPKGNMELIQPGAEILYTVDGFLNAQLEWFNIPDWTLDTKILSTNIGTKIGVATTEFLYKEPERNGKPYFNRLIVSYTLQKSDGQWYVIKDHASSIEKTKN